MAVYPAAASTVGVKARHSLARYRKYFILLLVGWTLAVVGSLAWSVRQMEDEVRSTSEQTARVLLEKDLLYREWSILHGGVYVSKSALTESAALAPGEPQEEREIRTGSGRILTLLNPATVSRQIFREQADSLGIRGHITSLNPLRQANLPDAWERQALERLTQAWQKKEPTTNEISSIEVYQGERCFRMIRPLFTVRTCFQCHEERGRIEGTLRGGISVTVPMSRFATPGESRNVALAHLGLWVIGLSGLGFSVRDLQRHTLARLSAEAERERVIGDLEKALAEVKTLSGLIPICASCKKIRDDQGYWTQIETYVQQHSNVKFSHSLCLDCLHKLYPQEAEQVRQRLTNPPDSSPGAGPPK